MNISKQFLSVALALLLLVGIAVAEEEGEDISSRSLDSLTRVGEEAQAKLETLIAAYTTSKGTLRECITRIANSQGEGDWSGTVRFIHDVEKSDRASALNAYRSWVTASGGDATTIKTLPTDWVALLDGWQAFYEICDAEGKEAYIALFQLHEDSIEISGFIYGDNIRIDTLVGLGGEIDKRLVEADNLLTALQNGTKTLADVKSRLESLRGSLQADETRMSNFRDTVEDILEREKEYNSVDKAAVNRKEAVRDAYDEFVNSVVAHVFTSPTVHEKEAMKWREFIEKPLKEYQDRQDVWLDNIDRIVTQSPFKDTRMLKGMDLEGCIETIGDMIGRIDHAL